jgi:hypothetical protein
VPEGATGDGVAVDARVGNRREGEGIRISGEPEIASRSVAPG